MVGLALMHLVPGLVLLGFAYLLLTVANKETGNLKLAGQIIAGLLVVVILLAVLRCGLKKNCPISPKMKMGGHHQMMCAPAASAVENK